MALTVYEEQSFHETISLGCIFSLVYHKCPFIFFPYSQSVPFDDKTRRNFYLSFLLCSYVCEGFSGRDA